jgi:hypothetical protein
LVAKTDAQKVPLERLGVRHEYHANGLKIEQVYVGYSALLLEDAYLKMDNSTASPGIALMDNFKFIGTRTEPSGQSCQKNIIYYENGLVLGTIQHIKAAIHGSLSKEGMRVFIERWQREGHSTINGRRPSPVAKIFVSAGSRRRPHDVSLYEESNVDMHYRLMCSGRVKVPTNFSLSYFI